MDSAPRSSFQLVPGSRIAVVGGGPAGSWFALAALRIAARRKLPLEISLFERKDLTAAGPSGCNMCAGILSRRVARELAELDLTLPSSVVMGRVRAYRLHWRENSVMIFPPDPKRSALSVYRAGGPHKSPFAPTDGLDQYLVDQAQARGVRVVPERVTEIAFDPMPRVTTANRQESFDLVVLACGVNATPPTFHQLGYELPKTETMVQDELLLESDENRRNMDGTVHVFFDEPRDLIFGALIPKGRFANVSLLGPLLGRTSIQHFLSGPQTSQVIGDQPLRTCGCRPRVAVSLAQGYYADRFVAVGDSCVTRLYKDGIGSAFATARAAAETALLHGIGREHFSVHYAPVCRAIANDNRAGRVVFRLVARSKGSRLFMRGLERALEAEGAAPLHSRIIGQTLWALFTGDSTYSEILRMLFRPSAAVKIARAMLEEAAKR